MLTAVKDLDLILRYARGGDPDVFAEIVRRHTGMVYHTCLRVLRDKALAEDASQDTFFRLMRSPDTVTRSLGAWLHKTATRRSLDILRSDKARRKRERERELDRLMSDDHRHGDPPGWHVISPQIDIALEQMDEQTRTLLVEHFLAGKTQRQIAKEQRLSTASVCRKIKHGLIELRGRLGDVGLIVSLGTLTGLVASQQTRAAPASLSQELGKMSMVSGDPMALGSGGRLISMGKLSAALTAAAGVALLGLAVYGLVHVGNGEAVVTTSTFIVETPPTHGYPAAP